MPNLNKVILIGHLATDPELRTTTTDKYVCAFRIGVNRRYARADEQKSDFINVVAWNKTAEFVSKYFSKGKAICVCGSIQTRSYQDNDGKKVFITEVVADEVSFMGKNTSTPDGAIDKTETPIDVEPPSFDEVDLNSESLPF